MEAVCKKELVKLMQEHMNAEGEKVTLKSVSNHLDAFMAVFADLANEGTPLMLQGAFSTQIFDVNAHEARNPKTGEVVHVEAHQKVKMKIASSLKRVK